MGLPQITPTQPPADGHGVGAAARVKAGQGERPLAVESGVAVSRR